jgi:hypothetical protein
MRPQDNATIIIVAAGSIDRVDGIFNYKETNSELQSTELVLH